MRWCTVELRALVCDTESMERDRCSVIFDLDGTLTDSKPGILGCLRKVLDARGIEDGGPLERFIGPPVEKWVVELLPDGSAEEQAALAQEYRGCYDREGWANNAVYPGVRAMLEQLRAAGFPLYVCTSKQEHFAVRILEAFALAPFFAAIYGDKLAYESHAKADLLGRLLRERAIDAGGAWMVGDRSFDIEAAHGNGVRCLAAGWGYGSEAEWAEADAVAPTTEDVFGVISGTVEPARQAEGRRL